MSKTFTLKKITSLNLTQTAREMNDLPERSFEPSKNVINNILNYSKALSIRKSNHVEFIETVLN